MNRVLLVGNVVLLLFLLVRLADSGPAAAAGAPPAAWTAADLRAVVEGGAEPRSVTIDLGAELAVEGDAQQPVDLGLRLEPMRDFACYRVSPRQLRLRFANPLPPARRFTLHFGRELRAEGGAVLPAGTPLAFETMRQALVDVQVDDRGAGVPALLLHFLHPSPPAEVAACVRVIGSGGDVAVACEAVPGNPRSFRLQPLQAIADEVEVAVLPKLLPVGGELPMAHEQRRRVAVFEPLELRGVEAGQGHIDLAFNRSLPLPEQGQLRLEPAAPFQVQQHGRGLRLCGEFAAGSVWSVRLADGFPGSGRVRLRHATARSVLVEDRRPELALQQQGSVLSTAAVPQLQIAGVNVRNVAVRLRPVYANNVVRLLQRADEMVFAPAEVHTFAVHAARNAGFTLPVDLAALLGGSARGLFQIEVWDADGAVYPRRRLLQVTDLGVSVRAGGDAVAVQVRGLADGEARPQAAVEVVSPTNQVLARGETDADGVALLRWPAAAADRRAFLVHVQHRGDEAFVDLQGMAVELADPELGGRPFVRDGCEAWVWPTRGIVRPGEQLELAVVLRDAAAAAIALDAEVAFVNPAGKVWRRQRLPGSGSGMQVATLACGSDAPTGRWRAEVSVGEQLVGSATFQVEAFVPDRLEAHFVEVPELRLGEAASVRVRGNWLDGGPAAGRPVELRARLLPGRFAPPGADGFTFAGAADAVPPGELEPLRGTLDARGEAELQLALPADARPQLLTAELSLELLDPSGRAVHALATAKVWRPQFQLGVRAGTDAVELCALQSDGLPFAGPVPVVVRLERRRWQSSYEQVGSSRWRWVTRVAAEVLGEWNQQVEGGRARLTLPAQPVEDGWLAVVVQSGGQQVEQVLGEQPAPPDRLRVAGPAAPVAPGGVATVTVTSPAAGRGFVTLEADHIVAARVVALQCGDNQVAVPLPADLRVPNAHVVVTLTRPARQAQPGEGPPWLIGGTSVVLRRADVATAVRLVVPERVLPEGRVECVLSAPGASRALVALVDQGVLQITGHRDPDPLAFFLAPRRLLADGADTGAHLLQGMLFAQGTRTGGDGGDEEEALPLGGSITPQIRPLALAQAVELDADGNGKVELQLPPYEGRVRWFAVAAGPRAVGAAAAATVVKAPLGLQLAGPRAVAPGDRFALPLTLRNDTGADGEVQLQWQVDPGLAFATPPPAALPLAAGAQRTLDVVLLASAPAPGAVPQLRVEAVLGAERRALAQAVAVRAPVVFATEHLGLELGAVQDITVPADWQAEGLQLSLQLSAHPDQQLRPALEALLHYPYGCVEQTTSKGLALLACQALLPRILGDEVTLVEPAALVQAAVDRLLAMQHWNGAFGWWPGDHRDYEFGSVYATGFLLRAAAAGAAVPEQALQQAVQYLQQLVAGDGDLDLRCHAIEVLSRAGVPVQPRLDWLCRCEVGSEARALLAQALARLGDRPRALALLQLAAGGDDDVRDGDGLLRSPLRLLALRFAALLAAAPESPRLPELAQQLQRQLRSPAALTTQEQAQALAALAEYFRVQPPAAAPQLGGSFAGQPLPPAERGRIALPAVPGGVLHLDGGGRGFALLTARGYRPAPRSGLRQDLALRAEYVDPDTGETVRRLRQGRVYERRIHGECSGAMANVVFVDLLPGGVEAELPRRSALAADGGDDERLLRPSCVDRRDDRVLLFVSAALPRAFTLVHRVRAVTVGEFDCPPPSAQAMYGAGEAIAAGGGRLEIAP